MASPIVLENETTEETFDQSKAMFPYHLPRTRIVLDKLSPYSQDLIETFLLSTEGSKILNIITTLAPTYAQDTEFRNVLAGGIFEGLSFTYLSLLNLYLSKNLANKNKYILFSPTETVTLYHLKRPFNSVISRFHLSLGISHIVLPDGLLLQNSRRTWQIIRIYEYTLGNKSDDREQRQFKRLSRKETFTSTLFLDDPERRVDLSQVRPGLDDKPLALHPNLELSYVVPIHSDLVLPGGRDIVPITRTEFRNFSESLILDCTTNPTRNF
ncbi:MAG: hypothetical protein V1808_04380 [Candidatus Daviesbacteria bacterium]